LLRSQKINNIEVDSHSDVDDCYNDCSVSFLNNDFEFLFSILNSLINANDLLLKFFVVSSQDRRVNEYVFDLIFQIIIEDVISDYLESLNLIDQIFKVIDEN